MNVICRYNKKFSTVLLLLLLFFASCKKSDNPIHINSVWSNMNGVESKPINSCFTGQWIRLEGSGFDDLVAIYCNGYQADFSPVLNTDNYITFQVPSNVPMAHELTDEGLRNTIRIRTLHGESIYEGFIFKDRNRMPGISSVSYTLPNAGETILLEGNYLAGTTNIYFPGVNGEIEATNFTVISEKRLEVVVPNGVGEVSGAIRIIAVDDDYFSPSYMFYKKGIFLSTFTDEIMVPGNYSNTLVYTDPVEIAAVTGLSSNPESIIAIPEVSKDIPVAPGKGISGNFFKYYGYKAFEKVIANSDGEITTNSSLEELAIQFDLYIPNLWNSGAIAFKMNKDRNDAGSHVYYVTHSKVLNSFKFEHGWRTITINFSDFPNLALETLGSYINTIKGNNFESLFAFSNFDMNGEGYTPTLLNDFQIFIANIRLVPTGIPVE